MSERSAIGVNAQTQPVRETTVVVGPGHGLSFWTVVIMALAMVVLVGATGHWSSGFWVAVLVFLLVGAVAPPAAIAFGAPALLYLGLTHGQTFIANVSALMSPPSQSSQGGQR